MVRWPFADIVSFFEKTSYKIIAEDMVKRGHDAFMETIDVSTSKCLSDYVAAANRLIDGYEPLVGYLFKKEYELRQIRMLVLGKEYGVPVRDLEERVLYSYA